MSGIILPVLLGGLLAASTTAKPAGAVSGLLKRTVRIGDRSYTYQVFVPAQLAGKRDVPVILFLHGIGQRGEGGFVPSEGATGAIAHHYLEQIPAVVLLPQCKKGKYWSDDEMERMVLAELDQTRSEFSADPKRQYLIGVSMGGFGAWHLAAENPGKFAALVSICGGSPLTKGDRFTPIAQKIGRMPVWLFHGSDDRTVPVTESRNMVEALKHVEGSRVRYNEYPGVGHNVWMKAATEPGLMPWLLEQRVER